MTDNDFETTVLVSIARIEEQIIAISDKIDVLVVSSYKYEERISKLETFQVKVKTVMSIMGVGIIGFGSWIGYLLKTS